jgi:hypothetical protein
VDVIRHQAGGKDRQLNALLRPYHQSDECRIVRWLMEDFGASIRPIENVVALVGEDQTRWARHWQTIFRMPAFAMLEIAGDLPLLTLWRRDCSSRCGPFC